MNSHADRIRHYKGTPREIGFAAGLALGARLEQTVDHYIARRQSAVDMAKLHAGALAWLRSLPKRFQEEFEGMAEGARLPLQRLVEWCYIEECEGHRCSGAIALFDGRAWVARNNDTFVPELWGYATIREVDGRIPTISFGMEGDVFAPTGINREKLWLHYNWLPVWDKPEPGKAHFPGYVLLTEALEVCRTLEDVEAFLEENHRDGGMMLFAVDGKTNEFAIFECLCAEHFRRDPSEGWIVGTNHYTACEDRTLCGDEGSVSTLHRFRRMSRPRWRPARRAEGRPPAERPHTGPGRRRDRTARPRAQARRRTRDGLRQRGLPSERRDLVHVRRVSGSQRRQLAAPRVALGRVSGARAG